MAISVDWATGLITCPQSDLTLISGTKYQITVDYLWQLLRVKADDEEALPFPVLFTNTPPTASTPRIIEINIDYYTFEFEDGSYSVDIINGNTNLRDAEVKNTVSVGTNNTTGFIDPTFLEAGLFGGGVAIDTVNGVAGTGKTADGGIIGTRQTPSDNIADALTIASNRGLKKIYVMNNLTVATEDLSAGIEFIGDSPFLVFTGNSAADLTNCALYNLAVFGEMDGLNKLQMCNINTITDVSGLIEKCGLTTSLTLNGPTAIMECYSLVAATIPTIEPGANNMVIRDFHGDLQINGMTGGDAAIGVFGGKLVIDSTCTGGTIRVRGEPFEVDDNSTGTTVVYEFDSYKINEIWQLQGLDASSPMTVTTTSRAAGSISQEISGDGSTTSTVSRL